MTTTPAPPETVPFPCDVTVDPGCDSPAEPGPPAERSGEQIDLSEHITPEYLDCDPVTGQSRQFVGIDCGIAEETGRVNGRCDDGTYYASLADAQADNQNCVAEDPCTSGGTTLWHILPCDPVVATTAPQMAAALPETGAALVGAELAIATVLVAVGVQVRRWATR